MADAATHLNLEDGGFARELRRRRSRREGDGDVARLALARAQQPLHQPRHELARLERHSHAIAAGDRRQRLALDALSIRQEAVHVDNELIAVLALDAGLLIDDVRVLLAQGRKK